MLTKRHFLFLFLSLMLPLQFLSACSPSASELQGERWVIFSAEQAQEQRLGEWLAMDDTAIEYWTPSESDILALENKVDTFLQNNSDRFYEGIPALGEYNRQYVGMLHEGKKVIYANYFCDSLETDWKQDFVFVMDGGDCFFQFKYDPGTGEYFDLQVNGVA